jgi:hypothetical protein
VKEGVTKILLKVLTVGADEDDMEPLDPQPPGAMLPPAGDPVAPGVVVTAEMPVVSSERIPPPPLPPSSPTTSPPPVSTLDPSTPMRPMMPWRIAGAVSLTATFALIGWQVQRLVDDQPWSSALMWASVGTALAAALCVLAWTWSATDNARRLVQPAVRSQLPDPNAATLTWLFPFAFVAVAVASVAVIGSQVDPDDDQAVSALPLGVAVISLLLAVVLTYRPLAHLAGVVRQVGGYSVRLAQWMWVPVVLGVVGIASIVALRFAGFDESAGDTSDTSGWALVWVVAVVAIAPCVIVVLLAWRAAASVEDAINVAAARRRGVSSSRSSGSTTSRAVRRGTGHERIEPIRLLPGAELLRLVIVTLVAGLALLSVVGAVVTMMLWLDSRDTGLLEVERRQTWDTLEALRAASTGVTIALLVATSVWSFVIVLNVRAASGRRRNPIIAAAAWPLAAGAVWWIADRVIVDGSIGRVVVGFAAQAAVLAVPFLVLERSADAIEARRTPLRIVYVLAVVLLVHVQGLGGLSRLPDTVTTTDVGRLAGYLAIGALILLCTTLAVTEACRAFWRACRHEADHHNMLVGHRAAATVSTNREPVASR